MIPGSASGRTSRNDTASRPKNRKRATAAAAIVPSTSAIPSRSADLHREPEACARPGRASATLNQCVVQLVIGQPWIVEPLKA